MTDAALTLISKLEELEREAIEERNRLIDHLRIELRKIKEEYGRRELLGSLGKFPTLWAVGRGSVEDLPPTADDTAEALLQVNLWTTGPRH